METRMQNRPRKTDLHIEIKKENSSSNEEDERRERFARALTRTNFGRHYWDHKLADRLAEEFALSFAKKTEKARKAKKKK